MKVVYSQELQIARINGSPLNDRAITRGYPNKVRLIFEFGFRRKPIYRYLKMGNSSAEVKNQSVNALQESP